MESSIAAAMSMPSFCNSCKKYSSIFLVLTFSSSNTCESSSMKALKESLGVRTSTSEGFKLSLLYMRKLRRWSMIIVLPLPAQPCSTKLSRSGRVMMSYCFS